MPQPSTAKVLADDQDGDDDALVLESSEVTMLAEVFERMQSGKDPRPLARHARFRSLAAKIMRRSAFRRGKAITP